jgi:hypothetical protein
MTISHSEVVRRYEARKGLVTSSFLSDAEVKELLHNLTKTSKEYLKLKKTETIAESGPFSEDGYRIFRDCILAEVCGIELRDPRIRRAHNMGPAI